MKTIKFIIVVSIFYATTLVAQEKYFEKTYAWTQNHSGRIISIMDNGNYLINCGYYIVGNDTNSSALLSITPSGELVFLEQYVENDYENIVREAIKNDTGYLLAGWNRMFTAELQTYIYLLKTDFDGNKIGSTYLSPDDYECGVYTGFITFDGGYMLGGFVIPYLSSPFFHEPYLIKLDILGQVQWSRIYDNYGANNWIVEMLPSEDGGAYLLLQTNYWAFGGDMALLRIDSLGNIVWEKNYDFNPYPSVPDASDQTDYARSLTRTLDGGFLITGYIDTLVNYVPQIELYQFRSYGAVFKTDSLGEVEWITFEHCGQDSPPTAASQLPDSSYVLCGSRFFPIVPGEPAEQKDIELFKLDPDGNTLWARYYGGAFNDYAFDMIPTPDDGFILCGRKEFIDYAADTGMAYVYVIKTNCMGLLTEPEAAFAYEPSGGNQITFTNLSLYAYPDSIDGGYYIWDFGDGSPPYLCGQGYAPCTGNTLTHQYATPGTYTATLTAIVCSDTSTVQALIDTEGSGGTVGTAENSPSRVLGRSGVVGVVVYPNPAQNTLQILVPPLFKGGLGGILLQFYTLTGQLVLQTTLVSTGSTTADSASKTISVAHLPAGVYVCRWQQAAGGASGYIKVAVVH